MAAHEVIDQVDGCQRLLAAINDAVDEGQLGMARDRAVLLVSILEGVTVPACIECDLPLSDEEVDRFTSWCNGHAPLLEVRYEG